MTLGGQPMGRQDQYAPLLSWRTRATVTLCLLAGSGVLAWHAAVVLTATGVGLGDLAVTLRALLHGHPLSGLAAAHPAGPTLTLTVWGLSLIHI